MTDAVPAHLFLCADLSRLAAGLAPHSLRRRMEEGNELLSVSVVDALCADPGAAVIALGEPSAPAVLGLCRGAGLPAASEEALRKAGHDPLRLQVLDLGATCASLEPEAATAKAALLISAAVARARAGARAHPRGPRLRRARLPGAFGRRALFTLPVLRYQPVPTVDGERCVHHLGCEICVEGCPADALRGDSRQVAVDPDRCIACGNCVTACPRGAIDLPGSSMKEIAAAATVLLEGEAPELGRRALAYVCEGNPAALEHLQRAEAEGDIHILPVPLACTGMLPVHWIIAPLSAGAAAVFVGSCGPSCSESQEERRAAVIAYCQELLQALGLPPGAVRRAGGEATPAGDGPSAALLSLPTPPRGSFRRLFETSLPGAAIGALAGAAAAPAGLSLAHLDSPVAVVRVNPETCTGCGNCARVCPTDALRLHEGQARTELVFDARSCVPCRLCVDLCPEMRREAISLAAVTDLDALRGAATVVFADDNAACERCGAPLGTVAMMKRIEQTLRTEHNLDDDAIDAICRRCASCAAPGDTTPSRSTPAPPGSQLLF